MNELRLVDACMDGHFRAMSLIHATDRRDIYADTVPFRSICQGQSVEIPKKS